MPRPATAPNATLGYDYGDGRGPLCVACVDREQQEDDTASLFSLLVRPKAYPLDQPCGACGLTLDNPAAAEAAGVVAERMAAGGG